MWTADDTLIETSISLEVLLNYPGVPENAVRESMGQFEPMSVSQ